MNRSHLRHWLEGIGIMAVVASLIFLGLQVRQERNVAAGQYAYDWLAAKSELTGLIIENNGIWIRGLKGEELSEEDSVTFDALATNYIVFQTARYLNRVLVSGGDEFAVLVELAHTIETFPGLRTSWNKDSRLREEMHGSPPDFWLEVEEILREIDSGERQTIHVDSFVFF